MCKTLVLTHKFPSVVKTVVKKAVDVTKPLGYGEWGFGSREKVAPKGSVASTYIYLWRTKKYRGDAMRESKALQVCLSNQRLGLLP
jgi:hypothetical protein